MVRHDFVSNSSTSSFMIVGTSIEEDELLSLIESKYPEFYKKWKKNEYCFLGDMLDDIMEEKDIRLTYRRGISDYNYYYIGLDYDNMLEDETKSDFENRIKDNFKELFDKTITVEKLEDCGEC